MLKDYLMTLKLWLEVNKPIMMLCLVETEPNVLLKKLSELTKSLKEKVPSEELKTILPLVLHLQNKLQLISLKPSKISLIPELLLPLLLPEEKLDVLFSKKDKLITDMLWVLFKVLFLSSTIQLPKKLVLFNFQLIPQTS